MTVRLTTVVEATTRSSVASDGVLTMPKITPWSSTGASSLGDWLNISSASSATAPQAV